MAAGAARLGAGRTGGPAPDARAGRCGGWSGDPATRGTRRRSSHDRTPSDEHDKLRQKPVTHRLENVGDRLFRAMVVVNETPGDETTTEQAAGFDGKPELTNGWFQRVPAYAGGLARKRRRIVTGRRS